MTYVYSVIRFVPDTVRGEAINLGVIAGDDDVQDWELRLVSNLTRAKAIDIQGHLPAALAFVGELEERIEAWEHLAGTGGEALTAQRLTLLSSEMQNIIQFTSPAPIIAASASDALKVLHEEFLVDLETRSYTFEKKFRAVKRTQQAYRDAGVPDEAILRRCDALSGPFEQRFDFGVHNGQAVQLVQCWSFQLPNQQDLAEEVKAWGWVVSEIKRNGGRLTSEAGDEYTVPADVAIAAVYVAPHDKSAPAFEEAWAVFAETDTRAVEADEASIIGKVAMEALQVL